MLHCKTLLQLPNNRKVVKLWHVRKVDSVQPQNLYFRRISTWENAPVLSDKSWTYNCIFTIVPILWTEKYFYIMENSLKQDM